MFSLLGESVPIYAAMPHATGGLGLSSAQLAIPLSMGGLGLVLSSLFFYPTVHRRIGNRRCESAVVAAAALNSFQFFVSRPATAGLRGLPAYLSLNLSPSDTKIAEGCRCALLGLGIIIPTVLLLPVLALIPLSAGLPAALAAFSAVYVLYNIALNFSFSAANVMVNEVAMTSPGLSSQVGAINGGGATIAAIVRAIGPTAGGSCWSWVAASHLAGAQFVPFAAFAAFALCEVAWYYSIKV